MDCWLNLFQVIQYAFACEMSRSRPVWFSPIVAGSAPRFCCICREIAMLDRYRNNSRREDEEGEQDERQF